MSTDMPPAMALAISASFGSVARWREQFAAMLRSLDAPALLWFDPRSGRLTQGTAGDAQGPELLAVERLPPQDVAAALDSIDWNVVYERYQEAVHAASDALAANADALAHALVLDVRRAGVFEQADTVIPGADWRDPAQVEQWAAELPADREVIVYCVYGHEVGRSTAMRLQARGVKARFLEGGISGWQSAGRPLQSKGGAT